MAQSKDVKAGGAWVEIFADNSPLRRTLKASGKLLSKFSAPVVAASRLLATGFAIATTAAVTATKAYANYADNIGDMAARTGLSVTALSELGYAAKMSGSELSALEPAIRTMQKGIGSGSSANVLEKLGLDRASVMKMSPEKQFLAIADKISQIKDPTLQASMALQVFGKSGTQLLGMINEGSAGIEAMRQEAQDLGVSLDADGVAKAAAFNDALDRVMMAGQGVANVIGQALAPALTWLADGVAKQAASFGKWLASVLEFVGSYENAMATLKLVWVSTTTAIEGFWDTVISNLMPPFVAALTSISSFFDSTITNMLIGWEYVAGAIGEIAHEMANVIADAFVQGLQQVRSLLRDVASEIPGLAKAMQLVDGALVGIGVGVKGVGQQITDATEGSGARRDSNVAGLQRGLDQRNAIRGNMNEQANDFGSLEARRAARQAEVTRAQEELNAAMAKTRQAAADAAQKDEQARAARDAAAGAYGKTGAAETAGTFNAAAIFGLGAGSVQEDILKATKDVASGIDELADLVAAGGMA